MMYQKASPGRNPHLLEMARGMCCLLKSPVCDNDTDTVVAAHSNQSRHGKSMGRKASDAYTVHCCGACHHWLDQGKDATKVQKIAAFTLAHVRQVALWNQVAADPREKPADRRAAQWALDEIA